MFEKFFTIKFFLGMDFGIQAIDDWPRAHWDETEFNVMLLYYDFSLIKIPVYFLPTDLTRNGLSLRPSLKSRTNIDYFLFITYGIESKCIRLSYFFFFFFTVMHFDWTVKPVNQFSSQVNYTCWLIVSGSAMYNVCPFLLMPDISMRSFIEEDVHVTHRKVSYL